MDALKSAGDMMGTISELQYPLKVNLFKADILMEKSLDECDFKADIVITDVPYGEMVAWEGDGAENINKLLDNLKVVLHPESVIAVISDKKQKISHPDYKRLEKHNIGKRKFEILQQVEGD